MARGGKGAPRISTKSSKAALKSATLRNAHRRGEHESPTWECPLCRSKMLAEQGT